MLNGKKPYAIVNTKDRGMGHWLGMLWTPQGIIVYDSLAIDGTTEDDAEQSIAETNCGQRAAAWLLFAKKIWSRRSYENLDWTFFSVVQVKKAWSGTVARKSFQNCSKPK